MIMALACAQASILALSTAQTEPPATAAIGAAKHAAGGQDCGPWQIRRGSEKHRPGQGR